MKKNIVIFVLAIIIIILTGYIIYDKVTTTDKIVENKCNVQDNEQIEDNKENNNDEDNEEKDIEFFKEYLKYFMPDNSASNFLRTIDKFKDEDIKIYILFYYMIQVNEEKLKADSDDGTSYTTTKEEIAKVVYKYFGIKDYEITNYDSGRTGIRRVDKDKYQIYWFPTGWQAPYLILNGFDEDENNIVNIHGIVVDPYDESKEFKKIEFKLVNNNNNYYVKSITYPK